MASEDTLVITFMNGNEQVFYIPRSRTLGNRGIVDEVIYNWNQAEKEGLWVYLGGYQEEGETDPLEEVAPEPGEEIWQQKYIYAGYERYCVFDEEDWKNGNGIGDIENENVELRGIWQVRYNGQLKMQRFKDDSNTLDRLICLTPLDMFWKTHVDTKQALMENPFEKIRDCLQTIGFDQKKRQEFCARTKIPDEALRYIEQTSCDSVAMEKLEKATERLGCPSFFSQ